MIVECRYLLALADNPEIGIRHITPEERDTLKSRYNEFSLKDAAVIKQIETKGVKEILPTNHDMKAVEYFVKEMLVQSSMRDLVEWIHFGLTSDDTNSIAYGLLISDALASVLLPDIGEILHTLQTIAQQWKDIPMLARTHGQPASPTTLGKEMQVFAARLSRQINLLKQQKILVKMGGASGNWNALCAAYPTVDWRVFTKNFIEGFNGDRRFPLDANMMTTQIEPHDGLAELFDTLRRINIIFIDCCQDLWRYISDGWMMQTTIKGEVGSSVMPHKVNPIDFENAEGNFGIANALCSFFATKLPISRLQRDLSDSTVMRNIGVAFAHCIPFSDQRAFKDSTEPEKDCGGT